MADSPTITQQYSFAVGEDGETDGEIEPTEESVETSLEAFGADVDHRERDTRIDQPEASTFGVDDRKTVTRGDGGEQHALFADTDDDQQTLTGEHAASQCLFESDDTDRDDGAGDEPADTASIEATPRAVATDGGRVDDDTDEAPDDEPADTDDQAERSDEGAVVSIPCIEVVRVADALDAERRIIERNAGTGHKTEQLTEYVADCRSTLSNLDESDRNAPLNRVTAAGAADELQAAAKTEAGDSAEELRRLAGVLRHALDEQLPDVEGGDGDGEADTDSDSDGDPGLVVGARVMDREADDPNPAVVVALPDEPAYAREIDALDGKSVADVNPEYGASGPVATVAYADDLDAAGDVWREADPDALARICADEGVRTYDFPTPRLREATMTDGGRESNPNEDETGRDDDQDTTFDPDAETVTDAWKGAFIQASWGYNQTNVELAQIVEVSESGKTVLARFVGAERVGHGRTSEQLRPTAEQYGDEFRLHVRTVSGDPAFRGTYPLGNDGDMDDGPTRRGSFYAFDNTAENSIRQTRTGFGH